MKDKLTLFTKGLLDVMFYGMIVGVVALPFILKAYIQYDVNYQAVYYYVLPVFIVSGIFGCLIIWYLRQLFKTVISGDCFVMENVVRLKKMGTCSFLITAVYSIRLFIYPTLSVAVILIVFLIAGLFSKVLARVFQQAVTYKLENDMTI